MSLINLTYPERLALIDLTKVRLAKVCMYVAPAKPCNDNQNWDNLDGGTDTCDPCLRLVDQVGASWELRHASLLAIANGVIAVPSTI